jgi:arylsulfatase A-like enzyme
MSPSSLAIAANDATEPNVVFIFADDLGINDLSCYGRKDQETPRLDRLAAQGMRFTCAYCAQPICSPSRAAVMSGKTPARLHLTTFLPGRPDCPSQMLLHPKINMQLGLEHKTVAEYLKDASYATACVGKWHLGKAGFTPSEQGFDFVHAGKANTTPTDDEGGKGEYDLTARAIEFIESNKDRPFFLYLPHNNPHVPIAAKTELVEKYRDSFNPIYAAMIHTLDDSVGRILDKLDELRLTDRTLVIFTSDNGGLHVPELPNTPATHNTPYRAGKGYVYEGGLRIPLIVRFPGVVPAGKVVDTPVINTDWLPTILDLCGLKPTAPSPPTPLPRRGEGSDVSSPFDGISLTPLLRGGPLPPRPLMWHFPHYTNQGGRPAGAIREGDWKLIEHYEDNRVELFHLATDIGERIDLSAKESSRASDLRAKLAAWRKSVGAQMNTPNPNFDPALHRKLYVDIDTSLLTPDRTAAAMRPKLEAWRAGMDAVVPRTKEK